MKNIEYPKKTTIIVPGWRPYLADRSNVEHFDLADAETFLDKWHISKEYIWEQWKKLEIQMKLLFKGLGH